MSDPTPYTPSLRDLIADEVSGIVVGHGYYSMSVGITAALEIADAILASSLIAQVRAEAWEKGYWTGVADEGCGVTGIGELENPYRADRIEQGENDD